MLVSGQRGRIPTSSRREHSEQPQLSPCTAAAASIGAGTAAALFGIVVHPVSINFQFPWSLRAYQNSELITPYSSFLRITKGHTYFPW